MYPRPGIQYVDQTQPQMGIKGRPVSSIEEARAISIDFDGSVFYFPDLANRRIYTKQINMDGTASLNVYELKNEPVVSSPQYVTREEFETTLAQLKQAMLGKEPESQPASTQPQQAQNNYLVSQLGTKAPVPAYVVANPYCNCGTAAYGCGLTA